MFRLNRFTGEVAQFYRSEEGAQWVPTEVPKRAVADGVPRFQISAQGLDILLLDTGTRKAWCWVQRSPPDNRNSVYIWEPFLGGRDLTIGRMLRPSYLSQL